MSAPEMAPICAQLGIALSTRQMILKAVWPDEAAIFTQQHVLLVCEPAQVARRIADAIDDFVPEFRSAGLPLNFGGVGVSIGGHVNRATGRVVYAPGLIFDDHKWEGEDFSDTITSLLGVPCIIENDANCMAEFQRVQGAGRGLTDFAVIYIAPEIRGIGCGIVIGGQLVHGVSGGAGEFGHLVVQPEGPRCRCGNRGCLQALAGLDTLLRNINWGNQHLASSLHEASSLVDSGHEPAQKAFTRAGESLGQGIASLINLLSPSHIIIGGPTELVTEDAALNSSAELFFRGIRGSMKTYSFSNLGEECEIRFAPLDLEMAAVGAAQISASQPLGIEP